MLTRAYVEWLESLPCNRSARRRYRKHGQWLEGWVPEPREKDYCEPMQQYFACRDGVDER